MGCPTWRLSPGLSSPGCSSRADFAALFPEGPGGPLRPERIVVHAQGRLAGLARVHGALRRGSLGGQSEATGDLRATAAAPGLAPPPLRPQPAVWAPGGASFLWQLLPLSPWLPSHPQSSSWHGVNCCCAASFAGHGAEAGGARPLPRVQSAPPCAVVASGSPEASFRDTLQG